MEGGGKAASASIPIIEGVSLDIDGVPGKLSTSYCSEAGSEAERGRAVEREELLINAGLVIDLKVPDPEEEVTQVRRKKAWYRRRRTLARVALNLLSLLVLIAAGVLASQVSPERRLTFRWLLFFGALPPIFFICQAITKCLYHLVEIYYFQEALYHFHSLQSSTHHLLFFSVLLVWYFMVFEWLWCGGMFAGVCGEAAYVQITKVIMKITTCAALAAFATFLAALVAKLISTHFLKSTHFKKLHLALQKEYILKTLSNPRMRRKPAVASLDVRRASLGRSTLSKLSKGASTLTASRRHKRSASFDDHHQHEGDSHSNSADGMRPKESTAPFLAKGLEKTMSFDDLHISSKSNGQTEERSSLDASLSRMRPLPDTFGPGSDTPGSASGSSSPTPGSQENSIFDVRRSTAGIEMEMETRLLDELRLQMLKEVEDRELKEMTGQEIDKLRTAVVVKTSSAMLRQHKFRTPEEQTEQVQNVKQFAKALFYTIRGREASQSVAGVGSRGDVSRKCITLQDVRLFYPDTSAGRRDAKRAFVLFSNNPAATVNMQQVEDAVLDIYTARGNIAKSLSNTESMISSLQGCLAAGLHFLFFALYMVIWQIDVLAGFSAFSATVLGLSFIFGNSIRNLFESMLFLFVEHPYDIGDWVEIDGELYEVIKITLMHTLLEANGRVPALFPNFSLLPKQIRNMTRRPEHLELLLVEVDFGMAETVKTEIKSRLAEMVKSNPNDYNPLPLWVVYVGVSPNLKARLLIIWTYACAPGDWNRKLPLRDRAIQLVTDVFASHKDSGATYTFTHTATATGSAALSAALASSTANLPPDAMAALRALSSGQRSG